MQVRATVGVNMAQKVAAAVQNAPFPFPTDGPSGPPVSPSADSNDLSDGEKG